ncbi:diguanylate cyclase domain-containing protein [Mycobacterium tilburgii]|uniref:diguanylate cyclase domain-containing protein n=1 Tax=Mycobacterium tilburgii TaxID=44467 RepID=UPI001182B3B3|nr:GGDEF domain-containing protein [Mycobacterium tilburgii]
MVALHSALAGRDRRLERGRPGRARSADGAAGHTRRRGAGPAVHRARREPGPAGRRGAGSTPGQPDPGLANRAHFLHRLEEAVAARQDDSYPIAVLCLDLDNCKAVNGDLGHPAGDELLIPVAGRLHRTLHDRCLIARLGGDEFAVLLEGSVEDSQVAAHDVLEAFRADRDRWSPRRRPSEHRLHRRAGINAQHDTPFPKGLYATLNLVAAGLILVRAHRIMTDR